MMRVFLAGLCATVERVIADVPRQPPPSPVMPYAECDAGQQCGACLMAIPAEECPTLDANYNVVDADGKRIDIIGCPKSANDYHGYGRTDLLGQLCYHDDGGGGDDDDDDLRSCGSAGHVRHRLTRHTCMCQRPDWPNGGPRAQPSASTHAPCARGRHF